MVRYAKLSVALAIGWAVLVGYPAASQSDESPVIAIDIALEPDATMIQHAQAANARLLGVFPKGIALDGTHQPHVTILQQFVLAADLDKVYAAVAKVMADQKPADWTLTAIKYYYIPDGDYGLAGIVVERTPDLIRLQQEVIDAIAPFVSETGTAAAFMSTEDGKDIQPTLIDYVAGFVSGAAGEKFNPHVTIGVATQVYLKEMLAEPFETFTFSPAGASVYQLGTFGTARRKLADLPFGS